MTASPTLLRTDPVTSADASAAHDLLCELRTRIATQALPRQYGVEASALESLWEIFSQAREAMKKNPGCEAFAAATTTFLNVELRPFTGKWHRAHIEGRLATRDGADEFRGELATVQAQVGKFADLLHEMAYGKPRSDEVAGPVLTSKQLDELLANVSFGIPAGWSEPSASAPGPGAEESVAATPVISSEQSAAGCVDNINNLERQAVQRRRQYLDAKPGEGQSAVGLALSGGGIRSATSVWASSRSSPSAGC